MNTNQKLVDFLYESVLDQKLRCDYFSNIGTCHNNSVWNKNVDERRILDRLVDRYKKYYIDKADEVKQKLNVQKEYDINSYLTLSTDYYINKYNKDIEDVNKYIENIKNKTINTIISEKLNSISVDIDVTFVDFIATPVLINEVL